MFRHRDLGTVPRRLRRLFYGHRPAAVAFQAASSPDLAAIAYFVATTFVADATWMRVVDLLLGVLLRSSSWAGSRPTATRCTTSTTPRRWSTSSSSPRCSSALAVNLAFLRVLRTVRLLRSYNVLGQLGRLFPAVRRNEEVILAALDLAVFVFMGRRWSTSPSARSTRRSQDFVDALYFTVATLSTTGFGDVTLMGSTGGELLSVAMMIVGISLFLRLAQACSARAARCATRARSAGWAARGGRGALQGVRRS